MDGNMKFATVSFKLMNAIATILAWGIIYYFVFEALNVHDSLEW
jgi:hypothetical protein